MRVPLKVTAFGLAGLCLSCQSVSQSVRGWWWSWEGLSVSAAAWAKEEAATMLSGRQVPRALRVSKQKARRRLVPFLSGEPRLATAAFEGQMRPPHRLFLPLSRVDLRASPFPHPARWACQTSGCRRLRGRALRGKA